MSFATTVGVFVMVLIAEIVIGTLGYGVSGGKEIGAAQALTLSNTIVLTTIIMCIANHNDEI